MMDHPYGARRLLLDDEDRRQRTMADTQQDLIDEGYGPIEVHEMTTQGEIPEIDEPTVVEKLDEVSLTHGA